jgi:hypothetical protein
MENLISEAMKSIPLNLKILSTLYRDRDGNVNGGYFNIINTDDNSLVSKFILQQLQGCNGIVISRKVLILDNYKGKGYGSIFCKLREDIARNFGYSSMMCTVVSGNEKQEKIMLKNAWNNIGNFYNKKTTNVVNIYFKKL